MAVNEPVASVEMELFATRVERRLLKLKMSQAEFARRINRSRQTVNRWLKLRNFPEKALFPRIAKVLKCDVNYLLGGPISALPEAKLYAVVDEGGEELAAKLETLSVDQIVEAIRNAPDGELP